jgi:hypothetical protein
VNKEKERLKEIINKYIEPTVFRGEANYLIDTLVPRSSKEVTEEDVVKFIENQGVPSLTKAYKRVKALTPNSGSKPLDEVAAYNKGFTDGMEKFWLDLHSIEGDSPFSIFLCGFRDSYLEYMKVCVKNNKEGKL